MRQFLDKVNPLLDLVRLFFAMNTIEATSTETKSSTDASHILLSEDQRKEAGHLRLLSSICGEPVELLAIQMKAGLPVIAMLAAEQGEAA